MRKELTFHVVVLILFFALLTLVRGWFSLPHLLFWLGGVIGLFLPDIDHLIYIFVSRPNELTSQRAANLIGQRRLGHALDLMYRTREERQKLVFHTALFQLLFLVLAFFVISSTGSLLGRGLVLGFLVHLLVDQFQDLQAGTLSHWFADIPFKLPERHGQLFYWLLIALVVCLMAVIV